MNAVLLEVRRRFGSPGTGNTHGCVPSWDITHGCVYSRGCWEWNLRHLEGQQVLNHETFSLALFSKVSLNFLPSELFVKIFLCYYFSVSAYFVFVEPANHKLKCLVGGRIASVLNMQKFVSYNYSLNNTSVYLALTLHQEMCVNWGLSKTCGRMGLGYMQTPHHSCKGLGYLQIFISIEGSGTSSHTLQGIAQLQGRH